MKTMIDDYGKLRFAAKATKESSLPIHGELTNNHTVVSTIYLGKMKIILCNAFSLSMIDREQQIGKSWYELRIPRPLDEEHLHEYVKLIREGKSEFESAVGHTDTAALFSTILGFRVEPNRVSVKLTDPETRAIIGQYVGPRLPEGATELPEGARIEWWIV